MKDIWESQAKFGSCTQNIKFKIWNMPTCKRWNTFFWVSWTLGIKRKRKLRNLGSVHFSEANRTLNSSYRKVRKKQDPTVLIFNNFHYLQYDYTYKLKRYGIICITYKFRVGEKARNNLRKQWNRAVFTWQLKVIRALALLLHCYA